jgi:hypothetical protein
VGWHEGFFDLGHRVCLSRQIDDGGSFVVVNHRNSGRPARRNGI